MKVRVQRQPVGKVNGLSLAAYRSGRVYDIAPEVPEYLVAEGYAIVEMRRGAGRQTISGRDRRRVERAMFEAARKGRRTRRHPRFNLLWRWLPFRKRFENVVGAARCQRQRKRAPPGLWELGPDRASRFAHIDRRQSADAISRRRLRFARG